MAVLLGVAGRAQRLQVAQGVRTATRSGHEMMGVLGRATAAFAAPTGPVQHRLA